MAKYQQTYNNSCGAAALLCAASELGVTQLPRAGKWSFLEAGTPLVGNTGEVGKALLGWDGKHHERLVAGGKDIETALYAVTSGDLQSYSMPSRVIGCAKQLGLNVTMYAAPGFVKNLLTWKYDKELDACLAQGVTIQETDSPGPTEQQRELIVFRTFVIGLHYVMRRPPNCGYAEYMDPGDGQDHRDFAALNTGAKFYVRSGISLMVSI